MGLAIVATLFLLVEESGGLDDYPYLFLLPWVFGLAIVLVTPSAILFYRGQFTLANPIIFATWTFIFPAFVLGGIVLAAGLSQPYYLPFIQDAPSTLPYTLIIVGM